jgi:hypothetical protein
LLLAIRASQYLDLYDAWIEESWNNGDNHTELSARDAMAFLFAKSKQKVGQDMVKSTKDLLAKLLSQEGQTPKVSVCTAARRSSTEQRNNV